MTTPSPDRLHPDHGIGQRMRESARDTLSVVQSAMHTRRPLYLTPSGTPAGNVGAVMTGSSAQHEGLLNLLTVNAMVRTNAVVLQPSLRDFLGQSF